MAVAKTDAIPNGSGERKRLAANAHRKNKFESNQSIAFAQRLRNCWSSHKKKNVHNEPCTRKKLTTRNGSDGLECSISVFGLRQQPHLRHNASKNHHNNSHTVHTSGCIGKSGLRCKQRRNQFARMLLVRSVLVLEKGKEPVLGPARLVHLLGSLPDMPSSQSRSISASNRPSGSSNDKGPPTHPRSPATHHLGDLAPRDLCSTMEGSFWAPGPPSAPSPPWGHNTSSTDHSHSDTSPRPRSVRNALHDIAQRTLHKMSQA